MATLLCPMKFAGPAREMPTPGGLKEVDPVCVQEKCAWWMKNGCAVLVIGKSAVLQTKQS